MSAAWLLPARLLGRSTGDRLKEKQEAPAKGVGGDGEGRGFRGTGTRHFGIAPIPMKIIYDARGIPPSGSRKRVTWLPPGFRRRRLPARAASLVFHLLEPHPKMNFALTGREANDVAADMSMLAK
jgi:hypothetical protein